MQIATIINVQVDVWLLFLFVIHSINPLRKMVGKSLIEIAKRQKFRFPIGTKLKTSTLTSLWTENHLNRSLPREQDFRVMPYFGELVLQNRPETKIVLKLKHFPEWNFSLFYILWKHIFCYREINYENLLRAP